MSNLIFKDPFFELNMLHNRVNRLFKKAFADIDGFEFEPPVNSAHAFPPVDIFEEGQAFTVVAELPGIKEEDLKLTLENVLTITGERKFKDEEKKANFHRIERSYGKFTRSFTLPAFVDPAKVNAVFENGILNITIPKLEEFKPKQIAIHATKTPVASVKPLKEKAA